MFYGVIQVTFISAAGKRYRHCRELVGHTLLINLAHEESRECVYSNLNLDWVHLFLASLASSLVTSLSMLAVLLLRHVFIPRK